MKIKFILFFCVIFIFNSYSQEIKYHLEIITPKKDSTLFGFQYGIFSIEDTSLIKGNSVKENKFSFKLSKKEFLLTIYSTEYRDTTIHVKVNKKIREYNIPKIKLVNNTLKEVQVKKFRPMFKKSIKGMQVNVSNTPLEKLDNVFDVLKASPKIISPDDIELEVIGKGKPTIFIDKQEVNTNDELKAMPADAINKIEIITNPSAKYSSEGSSAVIEIYTKGFHLEGMKTTIGLNGGVNTQGLPKVGGRISINAKKKKLSFSLYLSANTYKSKTIHSSDFSFTQTQINRNFKGEGKKFNFWLFGNVKMKYDINKNHNLILSARGWGGGNQSNNSGFGTTIKKNIEMNETENIMLLKNIWGNASTGLLYKWKTDTIGSYFTARVSYRKKINGNTNENNRKIINNYPYFTEKFNRKTIFNDEPNTFTTEVNYTHIFDSSEWELSSGINYSALFNGTNFEQYNLIDNGWKKDIEFTNTYNYTEQIGGAFIEVSKEWNKIGFNLGIRGETTFIKGFSASLNKKFIDTTYFTFLPNASILFLFENDMDLTLSYSAEFERPRFSNYDPFIRQIDSFTINYGNPLLLPEYGHEVALDWSIWNGLSFSTDYSYYNRPISSFSFVDSNSIVNSTYKNAKHKQKIVLSLNWSTKISFWSGYHSIWFGYSKTEFTPEFNRQPFNGIDFGIYLYEHFDIPKGFYVNTNFHLSQFNSDGSQQSLPRFDLGLGAGKKLLKGDLKIGLRIDNIVPNIHRSKNIELNYKSSSFYQGNFPTFVLSISYKFGRLKATNNIKDIGKTKQENRF